jgi:FkbM family methyltransferase
MASRAFEKKSLQRGLPHFLALVVCIGVGAGALTFMLLSRLDAGPCGAGIPNQSLLSAAPAGAQRTIAEMGKFVFSCSPPCEVKENHFSGGVERQIRDIFVNILNNGTDNRVLDIGMNSGYLTLLAASYGARVTGFDPQRDCLELVKKNLGQEPNARLRPLVTLLNVGIGSIGSIIAKPGQCSGTFQGEKGGGVSVPIVPLQAVWTSEETVTLVKIDTEGSEVQVLEQLVPAIKKGQIQHLVAEIVPSWWKNRGASLEQGKAVLKVIHELSMKTYLLDDPTPFRFEKKQTSDLSYTTGSVMVDFDIEALVEDRLATAAGCNLYFQFINQT